MTRVLASIFLLFQVNLSSSQQITTDIQGKKIDYFISLEKKLKSESFDPNTNHIFLDDSTQPLIYRRKEKNVPDLLVQYRFSKKDSIINEILYEWDVYNFDKSDNNIKSESFNKALIGKYNELLKNISKEYGEGNIEGSLNDLSKINAPKGLNRKDSWKPNENTEIEMYAAISNYYKKEGNIIVNPTHRIRLYIRNIKKKEVAQLDEKTVSLANENFENFITKLKENDFTAARLLVSESILQSTTEAQLSELSKIIDFNSKLMRYFTGVQMTMTGKSYLMIQYKYESEQNEVPKSIIKVLFDEENKIIGIQPLKKE